MREAAVSGEAERHYYKTEEWEPHGLSCPICARVLVEGDEFREQLQGFQDDNPIVLIVCAACEDAGRTYEGH